jgi:hypothetical protein
MGGDMKVFGTKILGTSEVMKSIRMATTTSGISTKAKLMAMVFINGPMENNMMDSGIQA